jgi:HEAT repeat protein
MEYEKILSHISDTGERLQASYLYLLSDMTHERLARFQEVWPNIEVERRRLLIRKLVEVTEQSFEVNFDPIFLVAMGDEDSEVRVAAVDGLWENEDQALIGPLVHLLRADESPGVLRFTRRA